VDDIRKALAGIVAELGEVRAQLERIQARLWGSGINLNPDNDACSEHSQWRREHDDD